MQVFHPIFNRFPHLFSRFSAPPFPKTPVHFPSNASAFHPKRKYIFPQTPKHFYTNTPAFFCTNIHIHAPEGRKLRKNVAFQQNKYYFCNAITKKQEFTFPALRMGAVTAKHALDAWIVPRRTSETGNSKT